VVEIRELLAGLAREKGVTVFMSSHILTEVDRLATRIGIIHKGRLIEELEAEKLEALRSLRLEIKTRNLEAAQSALAKAGFAVKASEGTIVLNEARAIAAPDEVATLLVNAGTPPIRLAVEQENLEDHFLRLTGEKV
jgi:ABC-2 type transport system ATP-binding protein